MRLIACHIDNFGKLSDFSLDFSEGVNVICEENAWGKSTLATFLKVMFYGFDAKKAQGAVDKERNIYRPWQKGNYGGELDFEAGGKTYRISRSFGRTEKADEFHLYDLSTFLESGDYPENIGETLFGLDSASFQRSIFIAQNDCLKDTTDHIHAKLGNLIENTNDINNYESAEQKLKDRLNKLTPNRSTGSIARRKHEITLLEQTIISLGNAQSALDELKNQIVDLKKQKESLQTKRSKQVENLKIAGEESKRQEQRVVYEALKKKTSEYRQQMEEKRSYFTEQIPNQETVDEMVRLGYEYENAKNVTDEYSLSITESEYLDTLWKTFQTDDTTDEKAKIKQYIEKVSSLLQAENQVKDLERGVLTTQALLEQEQEKRDRQLREQKRIREVIGIVLIVIAMILLVFGNTIFRMLGIVLLLAGIAITLWGISHHTKTRKRILESNENSQIIQALERIQKDLEQETHRAKELEEDIAGYLESRYIFCDKTEYMDVLYQLQEQISDYRTLLQKQEKCKQAQEKCHQTEVTVNEFLQSQGIVGGKNLSEEIIRLQSKLSELHIASRDYENAQNEQEAFEQTHDMDALAQISETNIDLESLHQMIHVVDIKVDELTEQIRRKQLQQEELSAQLDEMDIKMLELQELRHLQSEEESEFQILTMTRQLLLEAKEKFTAQFMKPISDAFEKYYGEIVGCAQKNWVVDANLAVQVKEHGELRNVRNLSAGYQDLIGLCMRFALADVMYTEEKPFLILDDPFVNLDTEKMNGAKAFIQNVACDYQVIYFTCHESRNIE